MPEIFLVFQGNFHVYSLHSPHSTIDMCSKSRFRCQKYKRQKKKKICYFSLLICIWSTWMYATLRHIFIHFVHAQFRWIKWNRMKNDCLDVIRCHHLKFIENVFFFRTPFAARRLPVANSPYFSGSACWTLTSGKQVVPPLSSNMKSSKWTTK